MMAKFLGKQKPLEKINLAERLNELSLDQFFESESWLEVTSSLLDRKPCSLQVALMSGACMGGGRSARVEVQDQVSLWRRLC